MSLLNPHSDRFLQLLEAFWSQRYPSLELQKHLALSPEEPSAFHENAWFGIRWPNPSSLSYSWGSADLSLNATDITTALQDGKGQEPQKAKTLCQIHSMTAEEQEHEVTGWVLKIRGGDSYKNTALSELNLLKEYYITAWIQQQLPPRAQSHFLHTEGLILGGNRILIDGEPLSDDSLALTLSQIQLPPNAQGLNCRMTNLAYPWRLRQHAQVIQTQAQQQGIVLKRWSVLKTLSQLYRLLLKARLDLSLCDLLLIINEKGVIIGYKLFDFERVSWEVLFGDSHPLVRKLLDARLHLPKRGEAKQAFHEQLEAQLQAGTLIPWILEQSFSHQDPKTLIKRKLRQWFFAQGRL